MSHTISPRQERHMDARDRMPLPQRVEILRGKFPSEDVPIVSVEIHSALDDAEAATLAERIEAFVVAEAVRLRGAGLRSEVRS